MALRPAIVSIQIAVVVLLVLSGLPDEAHARDSEQADLIQWISGACPEAGDPEILVRLDQVAGKAVTDWLRTGRFRDALELALAYRGCLKGLEFVDGTSGFEDRIRSLRQIICFVPMVVIETEQKVDRDLLSRSLAECSAPTAIPPEDEGRKADWSEEVRRYIHLQAAVGSPSVVMDTSLRYMKALKAAGFDDGGDRAIAPVQPGGATPDRNPDPLFASRVFVVGAAVASGDLDRLVSASGGKESACRSPFLAALGIMQAFQLSRQSALPIILKDLLARADFQVLSKVTREALARFDVKSCSIPGTVASLAMTTLTAEEVDRHVAAGGTDDLAMVASAAAAPAGIPGSIESRLQVLDRMVRSGSGVDRGRWLCLLGEAELEAGKNNEALSSFEEARGLLDEGSRWLAILGILRATLSVDGHGETAVEAARAFLETGPRSLVIYETIVSQKDSGARAAAIESLFAAAIEMKNADLNASLAEALIKVVDVEPGSEAAKRAVAGLDVLGIPGDTEERVVWGLVAGRHHLEAEDARAAKAVLEKALKLARPNMESAVNGTAALVRWLAVGKHYRLLDRVIELAEANHLLGPGVLAQVSALVGEIGEKKRAKSLLKSASLLKPEKEHEWLAIANAYARLNEPVLASGALSKVGPRADWGAGPWMTQGRIEMARTNYRDAATAYGKAADLARGECEPLFFRGLVRLLLGDSDGAERDFNRCIEMGDGSHQVYGGLGYSRFDQSRYEEALQAFAKALEMDADTADNHLGMALTYFRMGRSEDARKSFRRAVALEPVMEEGHAATEERGYVYSEVEKKAWEDMVDAMDSPPPPVLP